MLDNIILSFQLFQIKKKKKVSMSQFLLSFLQLSFLKVFFLGYHWDHSGLWVVFLIPSKSLKLHQNRLFSPNDSLSKSSPLVSGHCMDFAPSCPLELQRWNSGFCPTVFDLQEGRQNWVSLCFLPSKSLPPSGYLVLFIFFTALLKSLLLLEVISFEQL